MYEQLAMYDLSQQVLRTDVAGMPLEWIGYQSAARLHHQGQVAYSCGTHLYDIRGGFNAKTGNRSVISVSAILATCGAHQGWLKAREQYVPPLNNGALFRRDAHLCMYCGLRLPATELSRDHVTPLSQGGQDCWNNVVTACKRCNHHKAGRSPEQAGMALLAVPFIPTYAEYIYLQGRRVLADQLEFLLAHFPRSSPLQSRLGREA
jgi:5-methylcytosine-specific restriction endonuclease McrA